MECQFPTINENDSQVESILKNSKTIAIIGLSPDESKDSNKVAKYLIEHGYKVYPIYPKEDHILGQKVYRKLSDVAEYIDIVDVFRKPDALMEVVDECIELSDIKCVWFQQGIVNNEAAEKAKHAGIHAVQNKCIMVEHRRLLGQ